MKYEKQKKKNSWAKYSLKQFFVEESRHYNGNCTPIKAL